MENEQRMIEAFKKGGEPEVPIKEKMDDKKKMMILHLMSRHPGVDGYNEDNKGLGLRYGNDWYAQAGGYKNSLGKDTAYIGGGKNLAKLGPVSLNLNAGLASGYNIPFAPFLTPEIAMKIGKANAMVNYLPKFKSGDKKTDAAFGLSVGYDF